MFRTINTLMTVPHICFSCVFSFAWRRSQQQRDFSTAMSDKDQEGFYRGTRRYVTLLLAAAPLFAFSKFVQGNLGLSWRRWLTQHMCGLYFGNRAFYALKIGYLSVTVKESGAVGGSGKCNGEEQGGGIDNPVSAVSGVLSCSGNHDGGFHVGNYDTITLVHSK